MSNNIILVGDIHGDANGFATVFINELCSKFPNTAVVQVGDLGLMPGVRGGFDRNSKFPANFKFIRGNHDKPEECRLHPNYIGDYVCETLSNGTKVMYVGGAYSIDSLRRVAGHDWYPDEQIDILEMNLVLQTYLEFLPDIMITHEAPAFMHRFLLDHVGRKDATVFFNNTAELFNQMFAKHKPSAWYHGHWHTDYELEVSGTKFCGLGIGKAKGI